VDEGRLFASANNDSSTALSTRDGGFVACPGGTEHLGDGSAAVRAVSWASVDAGRQRFSPLGVKLRLTGENLGGAERRQLHAAGADGGRVILYADGSCRREALGGGTRRPPQPARSECEPDFQAKETYPGKHESLSMDHQ
jgi:hypothetical protein